MPATLTFPGVYVEEVPSGVRTITGVGTSITAFVGRTDRGPLNEPILVSSFGDFERAFGGLSTTSTVSYAVRDFFLNGGSQAIVVRLFHPFFADDAARAAALAAATTQAQTAADAVAAAARGAVAGAADANAVADAAEAALVALVAPAPAALSAATAVSAAARNAVGLVGATADSVADAAEAAVAGAVTASAGATAPTTRARLSVGGLDLQAATEGAWGNRLRARVDHDTRPTEPGETANSLFNLSVRDPATGATEVLRNLSVQAGHARQADRALLQESSLVRVAGAVPGTRPTASAPAPLGVVLPGGDPFSDANSVGVTGTGVAVDSQPLVQADYEGSRDRKQGLFALQKADLFNLLCIPADTRAGDTPAAVYQTALSYCVERRAMLLVDPPAAWSANPDTAAAAARAGLADLNLTGVAARNAAVYFPRVIEADPLRGGQLDTFVPCGVVAGVTARTDAQRGVWKAPAGLDAAVNGVAGLSATLTDGENGQLNPVGINCLRSFPVNGRVVWGARTLRGADQSADEYKYIPVRRLALFIEESLYRGTQWVVFEPNDEPLWAQIRLNVGAFMQNLFRQGAFAGNTPAKAYFVKCDSETTTQNDVNLGIVNILVAFAPLKPAEFVVLRLQQLAGQIEV